MSNTIFLSTVTSEFSALRARLARLLERTKRVHVRHQDDFVHRGVLTLRKLEEEIENSDIVLHAIGASAGSPAPADQAQELLDRREDVRRALPQEVFRRARNGELTYTQWEGWLAIALKKRLCCYRLADRELEPSQLFQTQHLASCKFYPDSVANDDALYDAIIASLLALGVLTQQELHRPIKLPYQTLGTLFKGRESFLKQLRDSLTKAANSRTAIVGKAIHGLGGVGKTRLAVEYAWQHEQDYTALLFVTADTPEALHRNLADLAGAQVLNLPEQDVAEEAKKVAAALKWLKNNPGWFLIIDNVDTEEVADHVEKLLADLHGGHVLITSRLQKWGGEVETLELDVLDEQDAANLLLERTSPARSQRCRITRPDDDQVALTLAHELDGLALALEQASAYICERRIGLTEYLSLWRSHLPAVDAAFDTRISKYPRSVAATWRTTLDQLSPSEIALLNLFAWFAPEPIPPSVLDQISAETLAPLISGEVIGDLRSWLSCLADYSMIRWNHDLGTVLVHRVVQEILRTQQSEPKSILEVTLSLLDAARPADSPQDVRTWPVWNLLLPHLSFAVVVADTQGIVTPTDALMIDLANIFFSKAKFSEAMPLGWRSLAIAEQRDGPNHLNVAICLNILAVMLWRIGRFVEAESLYKRAISILEVSDPNHPDLAICLHNLAELLRTTNRPTEAEPLVRRSLAIFEHHGGPNHPNVAMSLNGLALLLSDTNHVAEAEMALRTSLRIREEFYGPIHPAVATILHNLAELFRDTERRMEAEALVRRSLAIREEFYDSSHPDIANSLNSLAGLLKQTNRPIEAEPLYRRALAIREQAYGPDHPEVGSTLNNLAFLLRDTNRLAEAEPLLRRCLDIRQTFERQSGFPHPLLSETQAAYAELVKSIKAAETDA